MKLARLLLTLLCLDTASALAGDSTLGPVINHLPITLTVPGVYHFVRDLTFAPLAGDAITVSTSDVTIDLNGFQLICNSGAANTAGGIFTVQPRVCVQHGTIRGFYSAINLASVGGRISDLYLNANLKDAIGMHGNNFEITNNRIVNTGASTVATGTTAAITVSGTYGTISNNEIENTVAPDIANRSSVGIVLLGTDNVVVSNNRILGVQPSAPTTNATSTGIAAPSASNVVILGNAITTAVTGIDLSTTISGKYGDNTTSGVTTPYLSGAGATDIGGNN